VKRVDESSVNEKEKAYTGVASCVSSRPGRSIGDRLIVPENSLGKEIKGEQAGDAAG